LDVTDRTMRRWVAEDDAPRAVRLLLWAAERDPAVLDALRAA
jgi:hypothetical protein